MNRVHPILCKPPPPHNVKDVIMIKMTVKMDDGSAWEAKWVLIKEILIYQSAN